MQLKALLILPFVVLSLLLAVWSGLIKIGWPLPITQQSAQHGAIMVGSFLTTVILLERAVTFKNKFVLLVPLINGLSIVFFFTNKPLIAQYLLLAGSLGFCTIVLNFIYRYKEQYYYIFFAGSFCLAMGNWILIKSQFYPQAVPWWMAFLLFTIVAERLELSRFLQLSKLQHNLLIACLAVAFAGFLIPFHYYGSEVFATGLLLTAAWLLRFDMAIKSIKKPGQHRYSAILLITGYLWLIVTAILLYAGNVNAFSYDATLHSFFIGFVISMIFSHAPIIIPAVLKIAVKPYRPILYVWFAIMQLSLIGRVVADWLIMPGFRRWMGMMNGVVLVVFFVSIGVIVGMELRVKRGKGKVLG